MNLFSAIGKVRFSFYISIYIFILSFILFILYSYGLNGYNLIDNGISITNPFIILILFSTVFFWILLFKRIIDLKNGKSILTIIYILGLLMFFIPYDISSLLKGLYPVILVGLNPFMPLLIILVLSFKKGKIDEKFNLNLINHKHFGALFFNQKIKKEILNNRFLVGLYKYSIIIGLLGIIIVFAIIQDSGYLFKYKGYSDYNNTIELRNELSSKYSIEYDNEKKYENYKEEKNAFEQAREANNYSYNKVNIELNNKRNGLNPIVYIVTLLYIIFGFIFLKILPNIVYYIIKILHIVKLPFSIIFLYTKKVFSKLEEVEKNLKK